MFTVFTSKGTFKVGFHHFDENGAKFTECSLLREDKSLVLKGSAYCNPIDNFNRAVGRKLSLSRMLNLASIMVGFDKADRQLVWDEYFKSLNSNDNLNAKEINTVDDLLYALIDLKDMHGNLNVVLPQVGNGIDGNEITWNASVSFVIPDKDDNGKLVVKIF